MNYKDNWFFFYKIYCISIDKRPDRREEARRQFGRVGLLKLVEFVIVNRHDVDREQGIYQSHISCLQKGLAAGAERILIFEDDIIFKGYKSETIKEVSGFLAAKRQWNALFLGCIVRKSFKTTCRSVVKIEYQCLAHAYAFNRQFAESIIKKPWEGIPFDDLLRRINLNFYAVYPSFAFQSNSRTDNQTFFVDKLRRIFGGLFFLQKVNEFFYRHKTLIIISHLAIIISVIFIFL